MLPSDWVRILAGVTIAAGCVAITAFMVVRRGRALRNRTRAIVEDLEASASLHRSLTRALVTAIESEQALEHGHLGRMHDLAHALARRLALPASECETIGAAGWIHDIGMSTVPASIRTKPGRLTPSEMERMRDHCVAGARILESVQAPPWLASIVRHHHERWDGSGYPEGLRGEEIPRGARILALVDCFDALTTGRPYRSAVTADEALDFLRRESGRMFAPTLIEPFAAVVAELRAAASAPYGDDRAGLTDATTGLPDRELLLLEARKRVRARAGEPGALGLVAFEVESAPDGRMLMEAARCLEAAVAKDEILVRLDGGRFVLVTGDGRPRVLASRSLEILRDCQHGDVRLRAVHAGFPLDGGTAEELIQAIEARLGEAAGDQGTPGAFPGGRWGSAGVDRDLRPSQS